MVFFLKIRIALFAVEEIVQEMSGICHFSKLDLRSGYHQLGLDVTSREITTFSIPFVLHRHKRLTKHNNRAPLSLKKLSQLFEIAGSSR